MEQEDELDSLMSSRVNFVNICLVSSVPYIFNAVFLCLLVYKLQYAAGVACPWVLVLAPLLAADLWTGMLRRSHAVDCIGSALTTIGVCGYVMGLTPAFVGATTLFLPLWISLVMSTYYRCAFSAKTEFSILVRTFYHITCRGVQPFLIALQLDGFGADWMVIMTPTWTLLAVSFSGALFLVYCAPVIRLHSLQSLQIEATILIFLCCFYLLCFSLCGFLFIYW
jgi:hypothetical protein